MIVLGIETATDQVGCALGGHEGVLASFNAARGRRHAEILTPAIAFVCEQAQVAMADIGAVAVDVGPGLFTGLRVGITTGKAMAQALRVPMVGLSSLDLLAFSVRFTRRLIVAVIDARRGEVFSALYRQVPGGVQRVAGPTVGKAEEVAADLQARGGECLLVGEGALRYAAAFADLSHVEQAGVGTMHPSAAALVELAQPLLEREQYVQFSEIEPLYLRHADVDPAWDRRLVPGDRGVAVAARQPDVVPDEIDVQLVPMRRRHLRSVLRIEAQVYPRPWSLALFMSELGLRASRSYTVARVNGSVVGYCGLMLSVDDAHVTTIAVDPEWHRHQVGTRLLLFMAREAVRRDARNLTLEVRVSNHGAQALYGRFGFKPAGIRKNYYQETNEDALVMWAEDIDTAEYATRLALLESGIRGTTVVEDGGR